MDRTRRLYRTLLGSPRQSEVQDLEIIAAGEELSRLLEHPGYKRLSKWMENQRQGTHQAMEREVTDVNGFTLFTLGNTFIKYLFRLMENRAYNKIDTYIQVTIQNGKQHAEKRARESERAAKP